MRNILNSTPTPPSLAPKTAQTPLERRLQRALTGGSDRKFSDPHSPPGGAAPPPLFLNRRLSFPIITLLAALAVGLLFLLPGGPLQAQENDPIEYPEKGDTAVATYGATDPDGSAIDSWSLTGTDAAVFKIEDGVLNFREAPDYEDPKDIAGTDPSTATPGDNIYEVTVRAIDATKRIGEKDVTVEVTNVEEGGSMRLSAVQPQAGVSFYVIDEAEDTAGTQIKDDDRITSSIKWQWSKSRSKTTGFADIDKATNSAYTPKDTDDGYYLRVTGSYTDREGPNKNAQATSSYPVQLAPSNNAPPKFADDQDPDMPDEQEVAARTIAENTSKGVDIGSPIEASDLNPGKLTYTLEGTNADSFDIDRETGQLRTKGELDADEDPTYNVIVRATDPSGDPHDATATDRDTYSDTVAVVITLEDLAEDPQIVVPETNNMLGGFEETTEATTNVVTFTATPEAPATISRWSLAGPDAGKFEFADPTVGALTFKEQPDYEMPGDADGDNVYEITVRATDGDSRTGTKDVTVEVINVDEDGTVSLSPTQHRVGVPITATLKDDDDGVYGEMWQWYAGSVDVPTNAIAGATSDTYTPKDGDVDDILNAVATYRDAAGTDENDSVASENTAAVLRDTRNKAPVFKAKNEVITQAERSVAENVTGEADDDAANATDVAADNVGATIVAEDPNIATGTEGDSLTFSLSGADASKFRFRAPPTSETGATRSVQIEVKTGTKFDYETKDTYMVTLTASDDYGETAELALTINITDVNDAPVITVGGLAISGMNSVAYGENDMVAVATYMASGPESDMAVWSLSGDDDGAFSISSGGELTFSTPPDYENRADTDMDNIYMVTVMANDGTNDAMRMVTVTVTNEKEGGMVTLSPMSPLVGDVVMATVTDEDGMVTVETWEWARTMDMADGWNVITGADMATYTATSDDDGHYLQATATYTDGYGADSAMGTTENTVTANNPPMFAADTDTRSVAENTAAGMNIGEPVMATDPNEGDTLTYALSGDDAASFDIVETSGQLMTNAALDYETKTEYMVTVTATDGDSASDSIMVTIMVTGVNEAPEFATETDTRSVAENTAAGMTSALTSASPSWRRTPTRATR